MTGSGFRIRFAQLPFCIFFFTAILLFNRPQSINAQENFNYTEFLESISDVPEDSLAHFLYQKSGKFINADSLEAANVLLRHSIDYAYLIPDSTLVGLSKIRQGKVLNDLFEFNNSFSAFHNAFQISEQLHDTVMMLDAMSGIENYYYQIELIDSAIKYCALALKINKLKKNYRGLSNNYRALSTYQLSYENEENHHSFLFEGLMDSSLNAAFKGDDPYLLVCALTNYGLDKFERDSTPELGFKYLHAAADSARKFPVPSNSLIYALTKLSACYINTNQFDQAETLLNEILPMAVTLKNTRQLPHIYYLLGRIQFNKDSIQQALTSYYKAINLAEKYRYKYYLPFIYKNLFDLYYSQELFDSSFLYQRKYMDVQIKEHNKDMNREIARLSAIYQVEQKVETIDNLTIINNQRKAIINTQRKFIISLILGITVVSFLFSLLLFQFRRIKKAHSKLAQNALELHRKNMEIAKLRKKRDQHLEVNHNDLKIRLEKLFENKKVYLRQDLTLNKTASLLKTNTSYLSALINKDYDCKFNQFVNKYRIQKACELLSSSEKDIYSIEGIAELAGFKSKSVFNQTFKDATGVHPSKFKKSTTIIA